MPAGDRSKPDEDEKGPRLRLATCIRVQELTNSVWLAGAELQILATEQGISEAERASMHNRVKVYGEVEKGLRSLEEALRNRRITDNAVPYLRVVLALSRRDLLGRPFVYTRCE